MLTDRSTANQAPSKVGLWLDPMRPFSWNTARWLTGIAGEARFGIDWHIMSLAMLNEGREVPPSQRARMADSRRAGRFMAALHDRPRAHA